MLVEITKYQDVVFRSKHNIVGSGVYNKNEH